MDELTPASSMESIGTLGDLSASLDGPQVTKTATSSGFIDGAVDLVTHAPQLLAASAVSGVASLYNTGVAVANAFGADAEEMNTTAALASVSDDLASYYTNHKALADVGGFVLGSIIPGTLAAKALRGGQAAMRAAAMGRSGGAFARITGILAPDVASYSAAARTGIAAGTEQYNLINGAVMKALGTGAWQQTLEAAAFETAGMVANSQGEVLKDKDVGALVHDWAIGVVTGGAFGAVLHGIKEYRGLGKLREAADITERSWFQRPEAPGLGDGTQAAIHLRTAKNLPEAPTVDDILLGRVPTMRNEITPVRSLDEATAVQRQAAEAVAGRLASYREKALREVNNKFNGTLQRMTGGDADLANTIATSFGRFNTDGGVLLDVVKTQRLGGEALAKAAADRGEWRQYLKLHGEGEGTVTTEAPRMWRVADAATKKVPAEEIVKRSKLANAKIADFSDITKIDPVEADARFWKVEGKNPMDITAETVVHPFDIPMLKMAALHDRPIAVAVGKGQPQVIEAGKVASFMEQQVNAIAERMQAAGPVTPEMWDKLAHVTDVPLAYFRGERPNNWVEALYATANDSMKLQDKLIAQGRIHSEASAMINARKLPMFAALQYAPNKAVDEALAKVASPDGIVDAAVAIEARQQLAKEARERALVTVLPAEFHANDMLQQLAPIVPERVTQRGAGSSLLGQANSDYLSEGAKAEHNGLVVNAAKQKAADVVSHQLQPAVEQLLSNPLVAAEYGTITRSLLRQAGEPYVLVPIEDASSAVSHILVTKKVRDFVMRSAEKDEYGDLMLPSTVDDWISAAEGAASRKAGARTVIVPREQGTVNLLQSDIEQNARFLQSKYAITKAKGLDGAERWLDRTDEVYAPPLNPKDFPYYAFIVDTSIVGGGAGRTTMIGAQDATHLEQQINKIRGIAKERKFEVYTGKEAERYYQGQGRYEFEMTLHDARVNHEMNANGIMSQFIPVTDGKRLADDMMQHHIGRAQSTITETARTYFLDEFAQLQTMADEYADVALSRFGMRATEAQQAKVRAANPYLSYMRTSLDIGKFAEHRWLAGLDELVNDAASSLMRRVGTLWQEAKTPAQFEAITDLMDYHGVKTAYYDTAMAALVNHKAGAAPVTKFVRAANGLLANAALRWDALNSVVNATGGALARSAEIKFLMRGINEGNTNVAGKLAELTTVTGGGVRMFTPAKLQTEALLHMTSARAGDPLFDYLKAGGWVPDAITAHHKVLDDLTLTAADTAMQLQGRLVSAIKNAGELGAKITGNNLVESSNRYISAYCAKRIADLGVEAGVISEREARSIITTFVNRTEGSLLASQKPVLFNGAIGSAIGLFQSYQFRLAQQLTRFIGEGDKMTAAYMMGLQGTLFGANGLPGFQQINSHIIGSLSLNPEHRDMYDAAAGLSKPLGDLLLYGAPSNILQTNIYTRGDISPRHPFVLPTAISDVPMVGMITKALSAAGMMVSDTANTGNLGHALLTGIEHNGINRPIAGLASLTKALEYNNGTVVAVSSKDTPLFRSELYDFVQLSRLTGGKPLQEAIATDALYRARTVMKADTEKRAALAQTIRWEIQAGTLTHDKAASYLDDFVATGKKQRDFAAWITNVTQEATDEKKGVISDVLKSPYGYKMQTIMGGGMTSNAAKRFNLTQE